jgi:monomeric sarcosine oxidase
VGSAALYHLAKRGVRACGLDRFTPGHSRGSSHGGTRVIRQAYFEHPDYVPLLRRSYELWDELEQAIGRQLFYRVGLLEVGRPDGIVVGGVRESARQYGLAVEDLSREEAARRFPGYRVPPDCEAVFEQNAGYLLVEDCVCEHIRLAVELGGQHHAGVEVLGWDSDSRRIEVQTTNGVYTATRLIVTAGAWAPTLLSQLDVPFRVLRKHLHWFEIEDDGYRADCGGPTFFYDVEGFFYGFPAIDELGLKIGEHSNGEQIDDPLNAAEDIDENDVRRVREFLGTHLPNVAHRSTRHAICFYTVSPDEHFVVDRLAEQPNVVAVAGLSGHGFKFASALGEAVVELVLDGETSAQIGFLGSARFANGSS